MNSCNFNGNSDMYGLGIRLGFYLQWFAGILANLLVEATDHKMRVAMRDEVKSLRFTLALFVTATFLALVIQTIMDVGILQVVDVYITLLLTFGAYHLWIPVSLWRIVTCYNLEWHSTRFPQVASGSVYANLELCLILAVTVFQLWFWFTRVPQLTEIPCHEYSFLFARVQLDSVASRLLNIFFSFLLSTISFVQLLLKLASYLKMYKSETDDSSMSDDSSFQNHARLFQKLDTVSKLVVSVMVITAVELTIHWNGTKNVNSLSSAGQTIPFVIGMAAITRILYVRYFKKFNSREHPGSSSNRSLSRSPVRPIEPREYASTTISCTPTAAWFKGWATACAL
jgi:hypothetical protein